MDAEKLVIEAIEENLKLFIESQESFETNQGFKKIRINQFLPTSIYIDSVDQINETPILSGSNLLFDSSGEFLISLYDKNTDETKLHRFEFHLYGTLSRYEPGMGKIIILDLGKLRIKEK